MPPKHANATKHPVIASGNRASAGSYCYHDVISASSTETREFARAARWAVDHPRWLQCRYSYDAEGSRLFERQSPETTGDYLRNRTLVG